MTGTPTDAVMLALAHIMKDSPPDVVLSGINRGANLAEDVTYSGTVSAAMEGALAGIPSIAMSQPEPPLILRAAQVGSASPPVTAADRECEQVIALARVAGELGGMHISHMRDEAAGLLTRQRGEGCRRGQQRDAGHAWRRHAARARRETVARAMDSSRQHHRARAGSAPLEPEFPARDARRRPLTRAPRRVFAS